MGTCMFILYSLSTASFATGVTGKSGAQPIRLALFAGQHPTAPGCFRGNMELGLRYTYCVMAVEGAYNKYKTQSLSQHPTMSGLFYRLLG